MNPESFLSNFRGSFHWIDSMILLLAFCLRLEEELVHLFLVDV